MKILITGAAGFIGQFLSKELLKDKDNQLILVDIIEPPTPKGSKHPENVTAIKADLVKSASSIIEPDLDAIYIFHGVMSKGSEEDFELGFSVNVDGTRAILDAIRLKCPGLRVLYASSQAVYGQPLPEMVDETVLPTPETSYGSEKMMCEYMINDFTRKGFINGLAFRFPTIVVRPGKPSNAAPSFLSGMIREPLQGLPCHIPVEDRSFVSWVCSPKILIQNLVHALSLPLDCLPLHIRSINMPGIPVSVQQMADALEEVAGKEALKLLSYKDEPFFLRILYSWPNNFDNSRAYKLGFKPDQPFIDAVKDFKQSLSE
ncbi:UDPglucose 4-epimerase [Dipodascopsis uninucleata]